MRNCTQESSAVQPRAHRLRPGLGHVFMALLWSFWSGLVQAYPTSWEFQGTVTAIDWPAGSYPADFTVGMPYRVVLTFDTSEPLLRARAGSAGGTRYEYSGASVKMAVYLGTTCAPCEPTAEPGYDASTAFMFLRDNFDDPVRNGVPGAFDGFTVSLTDTAANSIGLIVRSALPANLDIFTGAALPVVPDPRLTTLEVEAFQICNADGCLLGSLDAVAVPTYGTNYFLSGRDCSVPDINPASEFFRDDCVLAGAAQPLVVDQGGGLGAGNFSRTYNPVYGSNALGTVFGSGNFGGPSALPILRGSSTPTDVGRTNSNLLAFQQYQYSGTVPTSLPLIVDLSYDIISNWTDAGTFPGQVGMRPGGATIGAVLSIIDSELVPPVAVGAIGTFNTLQCGAEASHFLPDGSPWPAGSIMGVASFTSPDLQSGTQAEVLQVRRCAVGGEPAAGDGTALPAQNVTLAAGQRFIVATSMQTPARGRWQWASSTAPIPAVNGVVDASHTLRVTFDPNAPAAVVRALADSIAPTCENCDFVPEILSVSIDIKPGSVDNCINPRSNGVIPVALFGTADFAVSDIRLDDSLKLGSLGVRVRGKGPLCSRSDQNGDGNPDLVCHFENDDDNWSPGQASAAVSGKLNNGVPFAGSDAICLVQ